MIEMRKILAAGAVASAAICVESIRERRHFRVTHYDLDTPKDVYKRQLPEWRKAVL